METTSAPTVLAVAYTESSNDYEDAMVLGRRMTILSIVIYSLAFVLGVTGNGLVIFITGFRMKKTVNTVWFLNLAIADFTFTLFLPLSIAYAALDFHWPFGRVMCKLNSTIAFLNLYASVYLLMVISVDRCISVRCPVWAQNHRTPRLASFVALGVWIVALVLCSPYFYFRETASYPGYEDVINCFNDYKGTNHYNGTMEGPTFTHRAMITSRFIFAFVIPYSVIVACYGAIILRLKRDRLTQSSKPFKVITAVIVAFFVCWFPYHVFSFLETRVSKQPGLYLAILIGVPLSSSLAFVNSCLNPILYVFMGHNFKESLRRSLFSAFEKAFSEEGSASTANTKMKSSTDQESQNL